VAALADILPYQRADFEGLLRAMEGLPVTIRLLDPPLHEFLPDGDMGEVGPRVRAGHAMYVCVQVCMCLLPKGDMGEVSHICVRTHVFPRESQPSHKCAPSWLRPLE